MRKVSCALIALLALGLPLHGGISVFLPEWARFWKELILIILFLFVIPDLIRNLKNGFKKLDSCLRRNQDDRRTDRKRFLTTNLEILTQPITWAICFLLWGSFLVLIHGDLHTGAIALRYLGFGFFAFVLCYWLLKSLIKSVKNEDDFSRKVLHIFCTFLVIGTSLSVVFGLWAKFAGGFEIVQNFYASTISSWVPGQTLPLYHEAGGVIRMQGLSSGPIELAHLCLLALLCFGIVRHSFVQVIQIFVFVLLLCGVFATASRAVELVLILCAVVFVLKPFWKKISKWWTIEKFLILLFGISLSLGFLKWGLTSDWAKENTFLNQKVDVRGGTVDHFLRPVEAINAGGKTPVLGQLGQWGPAARIKNLKENNDDRAPIAENIFADWFVQLGLIGFLFGMLFFVSLGWQFLQQKKWIGIMTLLVFFIPMNLATIFDMTPISLSLFVFLALLFAWRTKEERA